MRKYFGLGAMLGSVAAMIFGSGGNAVPVLSTADPRPVPASPKAHRQLRARTSFRKGRDGRAVYQPNGEREVARRLRHAARKAEKLAAA